MPDSDTGVEMVAKFFRALSDPTRLRLLEFLLGEEHTVSECVAFAGLSQGRVSTHLACLVGCGYVQVAQFPTYTEGYLAALESLPDLG